MIAILATLNWFANLKFYLDDELNLFPFFQPFGLAIIIIFIAMVILFIRKLFRLIGYWAILATFISLLFYSVFISSSYPTLMGIIGLPIAAAFIIISLLEKHLSGKGKAILFAMLSVILIYANTKVFLSNDYALSAYVASPHIDKPYLTQYLVNFVDPIEEKDRLQDAFSSARVYCKSGTAAAILNHADVMKPTDLNSAIFYGCYDIYALLVARTSSFEVAHKGGNYTNGYLSLPLAAARYEDQKSLSKDEQQRRYRIVKDLYERQPNLSDLAIKQLNIAHARIKQRRNTTVTENGFSPEISFLDKYLKAD